MKKILVAPLLLLSLSLMAAPIGEKRAREIAANFFASTSTRSGSLLYTTANWGQGAPFNNEYPVFGGKRVVSGCVATAAIVCYDHKDDDKVNLKDFGTVTDDFL